ncbi:hypothetical protein VNO77_39440 [Canavalia gladiata]|uniref:Uncharacterized protein n=1 Tax=Canavalia gladiata TaxID=3824 RepID=A0AAN9KDN9_CANGL
MTLVEAEAFEHLTSTISPLNELPNNGFEVESTSIPSYSLLSDVDLDTLVEEDLIVAIDQILSSVLEFESQTQGPVTTKVNKHLNSPSRQLKHLSKLTFGRNLLKKLIEDRSSTLGFDNALHEVEDNSTNILLNNRKMSLHPSIFILKA